VGRTVWESGILVKQWLGDNQERGQVRGTTPCSRNNVDCTLRHEAKGGSSNCTFIMPQCTIRHNVASSRCTLIVTQTCRFFLILCQPAAL
jgi:hypothetical protein